MTIPQFILIALATVGAFALSVAAWRWCARCRNAIHDMLQAKLGAA